MLQHAILDCTEWNDAHNINKQTKCRHFDFLKVGLNTYCYRVMGDMDNWEEDDINDVQDIGRDVVVGEMGEEEMMEGGGAKESEGDGESAGKSEGDGDDAEMSEGDGDGAEESQGDQEPGKGMAYSFNNVLCIRLIHFRTKD